MNDDIALTRRRFLAGTMSAVAASQLGLIGHDLPQEAPKAFADAVLEVAGH